RPSPPPGTRPSANDWGRVGSSHSSGLRALWCPVFNIRISLLSSPAKAGDPVTTGFQFGHGICFTNGTGITGCPAFAGHDTVERDAPLVTQHQGNKKSSQ